MNYFALAAGKNTRELYPVDKDYFELIKDKDPNKDYYRSVYYYNDKHYSDWKKTKSLAGITDVSTDTLVWDFDDAKDTEAARRDAVELCSRLISQGIPQDCIIIAFSGMKGFGVEVKTNKSFTPPEFKNVTKALAKDLNSFDTVVSDPQRIIRIIGSKHEKSGLYKFPITLKQLEQLPVSQIKELAKDMDNASDLTIKEVNLPANIYELRNNVIEVKHQATDAPDDIDFRAKIKGLSNCKHAILQGYFFESERSNSLMALGATLKSMGYGKEVNYNMLKAAARQQGNRFASEPFGKKEIWTNIIQQIYSDNWKGATYSCKNQDFLKKLCDSLGSNKCKHDSSEDGFVQVEDMYKQFEDYSTNIEKNTIKTGLPTIDENVQLTIGMPVGLLGAPSSGKTSLSLDILNNTSLAGISSVFFSMDMYGPLVYLKQAMRQTGLSVNEVHHIFKHEKKRADEIRAGIYDNYKNVKFSLKAGHTVQEMRDIINAHQDRTGDKVKLVLIDYLECISGPYSDATANAAKIAGELRDFATEMSICGITLVQPPKNAGDASSPLTSMRQIKGSSMLEQSFRVILGIYREGFGPNNKNEDRFITVNALKNTMGELFSVDHYWDGRRGRITEIDNEGELELAELRKRKKAESSNDSGWG